jgi:hypothetical protein
MSLPQKRPDHHIMVVPKLVKGRLNGCEAARRLPHTLRTKRRTDMRLSLILPKVEPTKFEFPKQIGRDHPGNQSIHNGLDRLLSAGEYAERV